MKKRQVINHRSRAVSHTAFVTHEVEKSNFYRDLERVLGYTEYDKKNENENEEKAGDQASLSRCFSHCLCDPVRPKFKLFGRYSTLLGLAKKQPKTTAARKCSFDCDALHFYNHKFSSSIFLMLIL